MRSSTCRNGVHLFAVALSALVVGQPETALADTIVWTAARNIAKDSDVSTYGTKVYAYRFGANGSQATTVNGVTFAPFVVDGLPQSVTVGDVTVSESPSNLDGQETFSSLSTPFAGLSSSYQDLLGSGVTAGSPTTITLQLGGLTQGQRYDFQWWSNSSSYYQWWRYTTAAAGESRTLSSNTSGFVEGGTGQYAIGSFTASGTSVSIAFTGSQSSGGMDFPLINAFQVRAVPEPSTYAMALAGLACGACSVWRRKRAGR